MTSPGQRIRLARTAIFALPPGLFSNLLGIDTQHLAAIENGALTPAPDLIHSISALTKAAPGWYKTGKAPPLADTWAYFEHPFPGMENLGSHQDLVASQVLQTITDIAPKALADLDIRQYYLAHVEGDKWKHIVVLLRPNAALILRLASPYTEVCTAALQKAGASKAGETELNAATDAKIGSPDHTHTHLEEVLALFRQLGLSALTKAWQRKFFRSRANIPLSISQHLKKLAATLRGLPAAPLYYNGLSYTRDELDAIRPLAWKHELGLD